MLYVRNIPVKKAKHIHKRLTRPLVRGDVTQVLSMTVRLQLKKEKKNLVMSLKKLGAKTN
jgi:hypothetical protein